MVDLADVQHCVTAESQSHAKRTNSQSACLCDGNLGVSFEVRFLLYQATMTVPRVLGHRWTKGRL